MTNAAIPTTRAARLGLWVARARRAVTVVANVLEPVGRVFGRILGPLVAVVTPSGWIVLALGAGSLLLAGYFGWAEFSYLGAVLVAALVFACIGLVGRASYGVLIELNPRRVVVGDRAMGRMVVSNTGHRRLPANRMELPVGGGLAEFQLPAMTPKQEHEELFQVPTHQRAVIVAGPARSVRGDQLGLLRRSVRWSDPVELFVHPRTVRLAASAAGLVRDLEGQVSQKITNNDLEFHALRPYVAGDDRRYVHWRTSARIGQLMVRQFQETRRSQVTILLPTRPELYGDRDEFEIAVSVAASIAAQIIADGTQLAVVSESGLWRTRTTTSMLDSSSRLEFGHTGGYATFREAARDHTKRLPAASVVIMIAGSGAEIADYRGIQTLTGSDTSHLGFRVIRDESPRIGSIGGVSMVTLGRLDDLPALFRGMST